MWQDVTVVLRDDTNNDVIEAIRDQLNKQVNHARSIKCKGWCRL